MERLGDEKNIRGKQNNPGKLTDGKHEGKASEERRKQAADFDLKEAKEEIIYKHSEPEDDRNG